MGIPLLSGQVQNPFKKKKREGGRETGAGRLISTADRDREIHVSHFFNSLDCQT